MKLELKSVKISLSQSEETTAFTGILCVNGQKVANVSNAGRGGANIVYPVKVSDAGLVKQADEYCKTLPPVKDDEYGELPMDLEFWISLEIDKIVEVQSQQKFLKKLEKATLKGIAVGNPNDLLAGYKILKLSTPVANYFLSKTGVEMLKKLITSVKSKLLPGEQILNTNIPSELLK
jgi:hypothetical protein